MAEPVEQSPHYSRPHPAHSALVWVGIVAGVVFVVAVVFFVGFSSAEIRPATSVLTGIAMAGGIPA